MAKKDIEDKIYILIKNIEEGVRQIESSDKTLRLREKIPEIKENIAKYLSSKNIEAAINIRNLLMYNAALPGEPYKSNIFTAQIAIDGKATDLKELNSKLDQLLKQLE